SFADCALFLVTARFAQELHQYSERGWGSCPVERGLTLRCVRIRVIARAHPENVGFRFLSLRHRPETHRFSGGHWSSCLGLCAAVSARTSGLHEGRPRVLLFSDRPIFSEAVYDCDLVQSSAAPNLRASA